jgi:hypothetical protein
VLRQPGATSALRPEVQPVPDPEVHQPAKTINRAPQLLDPRDKSARRTSSDVRWAVVPAVWPKKAALEPRYEHRSLTAPTSAPAINPADYDDGGWKAGF